MENTALNFKISLKDFFSQLSFVPIPICPLGQYDYFTNCLPPQQIVDIQTAPFMLFVRQRFPVQYIQIDPYKSIDDEFGFRFALQNPESGYGLITRVSPQNRQSSRQDRNHYFISNENPLQGLRYLGTEEPTLEQKVESYIIYFVKQQDILKNFDRNFNEFGIKWRKISRNGLDIYQFRINSTKIPLYASRRENDPQLQATLLQYFIKFLHLHIFKS